MRVTIGGDNREELPAEYEAVFSYVMLPTGESLIFKRKYHIGNLYLEQGDYNLKLRYYSPYNEDFDKRFKRAQRRNAKLKDYERFEGVVESNMCPFYYKKE
jgi:hypothetical protein